jgi:hypothetical protein
LYHIFRVTRKDFKIRPKIREKSGRTYKSDFHFVIFVTYLKRPNIGKDINKNIVVPRREHLVSFYFIETGVFDIGRGGC